MPTTMEYLYDGTPKTKMKASTVVQGTSNFEHQSLYIGCDPCGTPEPGENEHMTPPIPCLTQAV